MILDLYDITLEELVGCNPHITDFKNLIGGIKLRIPTVNQAVNQILEETLPFYQDYYRKIEEIFDDVSESIDAPIKDEIETKENKTTESDFYRPNNKKGRAYPGIIPGGKYPYHT